MAGIMRNCFGNKQRPVIPRPVESDTIFPVYRFDDVFRSCVVVWTLRFDDVLDAGKLHLALAGLLEIGSWKKLGGRLRLNKNGKLEVHVPEKFTDERPAVRFSHNVFPHDIDEHPLASHLPNATEGPSIQSNDSVLAPLVTPPDAPETHEDYVRTDQPQIGLHVTSFQDATLVGIMFPHTMTDVMGMHAIVKGMSLVLAGRESEISDLMGTAEDVLQDVGTPSDAKEPYILATKRSSTVEWTRFVLRLAWQLVRKSKAESHLMFLPADFMAHIRRKAKIGLPEELFLSDGDILSAWVAQKAISADPRARPAVVTNAVDLRGRLTSIFKPDDTYVQNLIVLSYALLNIQETATCSLGHMASRIRTQLMEQITEPQTRAIIREYKESSRPTGPLFGDPKSKYVMMTNWTKAKFFNVVDFSPAVIRPGRTPGRMVNHWAQVRKQGKVSVDMMVILGKDLQGNYWLAGTLLPEAWQKVAEEFAEFNASHQEKQPSTVTVTEK